MGTMGGVRKLAGHAMKEAYIMINEAKVVLADIADDTNIFHGIDTVLLSKEAFECPTEAPPVAPPTAADEKDEKEDEDGKANEEDSSASVTGFSAVMIAIFALSTFVF